MLSQLRKSALAALLCQALQVHAFIKLPLGARQVPANATGVKTITSPFGATLRYKTPEDDGICETTEGVNSYSGYIDLAPDVHTFFWFFESRSDPANDPITLWLNGGPGSDSLIGLFQELGPCNVTEDIETVVNPYSWNSFSNLLFLSQPLGVGFSYSDAQPGSLDDITGSFLNTTYRNATGRWPVIDASKIDTTDLAAAAAWHVLQAFYSALPQLDSEVKSKEFNLWTESYGGHYGPAFFNYFYEQNEKIANGSVLGYQLNMNTLGVGNGIIDEYIQAPFYPEFAANNSYGIRSINDTVYNYMKMATYMPGGCLDQIETCRATNKTTPADLSLCSEATSMCRDNVEGPYYAFGGRGVYDIRAPYDDPNPPDYFVEYLNTARVQNALGVNTNYTTSNSEVYYAFQDTGDFIYDSFLKDLEMLLDNGVRVHLFYGDADYICNVKGGEAVSLAINHTYKGEFAAAGYEPFMVDDVEYGSVRQYGNFSFLVIYEAGHLVPYYQPVAALEMFNRTINHWNIADGTEMVVANTTSEGNATITHTEAFVPLPTPTESPTVGGKVITDPLGRRKKFRPSF